MTGNVRLLNEHMAVNCVIVIGLKTELSEIELQDLRARLLDGLKIDSEDFHNHTPFQPIGTDKDGPMPSESQGYIIYDLNICLRYYGLGYRKG